MDTVKISIDNGIRLSFTYSLYMRIGELIKAVPGYKWDKVAKCWVWPATPQHAHEINDTLMGISGIARFGVEPDPEFKTLVDEFRGQQVHNTTKYTDQPEIPGATVPFWQHQRQAYYFCEPLKAAYLNMHMGTGKTGVALMLIKNRSHKKTLVMCPKSVTIEWPKQVAKFLGDSHRAIVLKGSVKDRCKQIENTRGDNLIFVTNFEAALKREFIDSVYDAGIDFLILDEAHRIKTWNGSYSKMLRLLARRLNPHRLCLSGTPMAHSPLDIWAQYNFLDPNILGDSWFSFKNRYAVKSKYHPGIVGYQNMDELNKRLNTIMFKADQSVIELPELIESERHYEMTPIVEKEYVMLWQYFCSTILQDMEYGQKITALLKCQQLCSGFLKNGDTIADVHDQKLDVLKDVLFDTDNAEPIVIFCRFQHEIAMIRAALASKNRGHNGEDSVGELSGACNDLKDFQSGAIRILIVQIQAGSLGIDLTRAATAIFYSLDWSLSNFDQARARVHRPGQTRTTHIIYLVANRPGEKTSIDQDILSALRARKDFVTAVLADK